MAMGQCGVTPSLTWVNTKRTVVPASAVRSMGPMAVKVEYTVAVFSKRSVYPAPGDVPVTGVFAVEVVNTRM